MAPVEQRERSRKAVRPDGGAADRVRVSHAQTRTTVRLVLAFAAAAAVAAGLDAPRWLSLHLFLAGAVVLAISGVSLMLTVTWSAAPAPASGGVAAQRAAIAVGAAGIAVARQAELARGWFAAFGTLYLTGLVLLAVLLVTTIRRSTERRFDVAVAGYLAAVVAGLAGVGLGVVMAVDGVTIDRRSAHLTANLLGLVGITVAATMPFFAATVGRSKMAPHATPRRLAIGLAAVVVPLAVAVPALATGRRDPAVAALAVYAAAVVGVLTTLPRPTRRQLDWAGPRLLAVWLGGAWWAVAVAAAALTVADDRPPFDGRWLGVLVVAGYAQVLWGSLAYLLPMLRGGGPQHLAAGFATTRSWPGLAAANVAGVTLTAGLPAWTTAIAVGTWVVDAAWRAARVGTRRADRPA